MASKGFVHSGSLKDTDNLHKLRLCTCEYECKHPFSKSVSSHKPILTWFMHPMRLFIVENTKAFGSVHSYMFCARCFKGFGHCKLMFMFASRLNHCLQQLAFNFNASTEINHKSRWGNERSQGRIKDFKAILSWFLCM